MANDSRPPTRRLDELLGEVEGVEGIRGDAAVPISGVFHDSRVVEPGGVFVALAGRYEDGTRFVEDAVSRGAVAIVSEAAPARQGIPWVLVRRARLALADLAAAWYGYPSRDLRLVGVTGTDGKTTTVRLIGGLLAAAGQRTGWYTTVDLRVGDELRRNEDHHTTPEAPRVQQVLAEFRAAGARYAVLEASSHALAQDRLRNCAFDVAVFTNLSAEHLDYHQSLDAYFAAKARLFAMVAPALEASGSRYAVLNADDPTSERLGGLCRVPVVSYGMARGAHFRGEALELSLKGTRLRVREGAEEWELQTRFLGKHNVSNWLAAVAVARQEGVAIEAIQAAGEQLAPAAGRLQPVDVGQPFRVFVDFAHTPQALEASLRTLRAVGANRVLVTFGHAGGRTEANRPVLGEIAARRADYFVITSDDAYPEHPAAIAAAIEAGAQQAGSVRGRNYDVCLDRRSAIELLFERALPGDAVLLAGKGHEDFLRVEATAVSWSDVEVAASILKGRG
jgi:UDP-N-acetylmuramoyl-L-alanyl-D-glutamate--2,6-diaminopimelate ligase